MITSTRDAITIYCLHCQQTHQIPADAEEQCPQCRDAYCGGDGSRPCIEVRGQAAPTTESAPKPHPLSATESR